MATRVAKPRAETDLLERRVLTCLYKISRLAGKTDNPQTALNSIIDELIAFFGAVSGTISLINPDTGKLETEVSRGHVQDIDQLRLRLGQGITGWVAFHSKPLLVPDVAREPRYLSVKECVRCEMAAPMEDNGQVIGVITLDSDQVEEFSESDLQTLLLLTTEATSVVQRLWKLKHLKSKASQLEILTKIGQSLVTKLEVHELIDSVTRESHTIARCRLCTIQFYDAETNTMCLQSAFPAELAKGIVGAPVPLEDCLSAAVVRTHKQIEHLNLRNPEFLDFQDVPEDSGLFSVLSTPMIYEGEVIGVVNVFTNQVHRFANDEKRLLNTLSTMAAVAIQNARLYARVFESEENLRRNEKLTTLGLLAAEIAHEIRNPLTVLKLLFGSLGLDFPEDDPRRTDVHIIREKMDQLEAIVGRVLSFAKAPESLHSRWNLDDIIRDTCLLIRLKLHQSKIHMDYLPDPHPLMVEVHKGQIQQALLNLLLNATEAMTDGGMITIRSRAETTNGARCAVVEIEDTGPGIPEELRGRIFSSFLSGKSEGTGLGLSIVKRLLQSHHGDIELVRTDSSGTVMRLWLPRLAG